MVGAGVRDAARAHARQKHGHDGRGGRPSCTRNRHRSPRSERALAPANLAIVGRVSMGSRARVGAVAGFRQRERPVLQGWSGVPEGGVNDNSMHGNRHAESATMITIGTRQAVKDIGRNRFGVLRSIKRGITGEVQRDVDVVAAPFSLVADPNRGSIAELRRAVVARQVLESERAPSTFASSSPRSARAATATSSSTSRTWPPGPCSRVRRRAGRRRRAHQLAPLAASGSWRPRPDSLASQWVAPCGGTLCRWTRRRCTFPPS